MNRSPRAFRRIPLAPGPLGEEDAQGVKARGVELVELHVLEGSPLR